jgi:hypothetical protein
MKTAETEFIYSTHKRRRLVFFRTISGTFSYREERYYKNEASEGWASLDGHKSYYADIETARREAFESIDWIAEKPKNEN